MGTTVITNKSENISPERLRAFFNVIRQWIHAHRSNQFTHKLVEVMLDDKSPDNKDVSSSLFVDDGGHATIHLYVDYIEQTASAVEVGVYSLTYFLLSHELGHLIVSANGGKNQSGMPEDQMCDCLALSDIKKYDQGAVPNLTKMLAVKRYI